MSNFCETAITYFHSTGTDPLGIKLPEGFTHIADALPPEDRPVLAIRKSGYVTCEFEVITAHYMPTYRPLSPWRGLDNDSVHDSGAPVLGWMFADAILQPR